VCGASLYGPGNINGRSTSMSSTAWVDRRRPFSHMKPGDVERIKQFRRMLEFYIFSQFIKHGIALLYYYIMLANIWCKFIGTSFIRFVVRYEQFSFIHARASRHWVCGCVSLGFKICMEFTFIWNWVFFSSFAHSVFRCQACGG
jgi:hypothetical protein